MALPRARIIGLGSYLPKRVLTNADLEKMVQTSDEWISTRTGIKERRIAEKDEFSSDMGAKAAVEALQKAHVSIDDVDLILVATMTPDYLAPSTAALIQAKLNAKRAAALDLQAACSGYLYGLSVAKAYVDSGLYKTVLLIASEKMSAFMDYEDRGTCVLFGDGATAALISPQGTGLMINSIYLGADGSCYDIGIIPAGGAKMPASEESVRLRQHYFKMQGKEVFKHAVRRMEEAGRICLKQAETDEKQISWIIPHQANIRILEAVEKRFSTKVYRTVHKYGNTSASSIGIALDELLKEYPLKKQEKVLLVAFGVGLTWGAALLTQM